MRTPNSPERWRYRQQQWEHNRPRIVESCRAGADGWLTLHAEEPDPAEEDRMIHALAGGVYVGVLFVGWHPDAAGHLEGAPEVHPDYRRRGVCRALYDWAADLYGAPMAPATIHSDDAAAFWRAYRLTT